MLNVKFKGGEATKTGSGTEITTGTDERRKEAIRLDFLGVSFFAKSVDFDVE